MRHGGPIVPLAALDRGALALAGGKAANLGELIGAGLPVPPGFCITTGAYREAAQAVGLGAIIEAASLRKDGAEALSRVAADARGALLAAPLPELVAAAIRAAYAELGAADEPTAVAVRSSATAEDLPDASFAGQQDTYLDVRGEAALLEAVRRCWASLWTERAVAYRAANGIDQRSVLLAVVVQRMVPAATAGVLFTANPLTGRRGEAVIDAAPGLGEAVVSGAVNPDHFVVDVAEQRIVERRRGAGGTGVLCLTDEQVLELARLGKRVAVHYGAPQDLEWAYDRAGTLWLLQARPITTLYPLPGGARADAEHLAVYFSINVAQGVLGPLTPMGSAALRRFAAAAGRLLGYRIGSPDGPLAIVEAGGRLFANVTPLLRNPLGRRLLLAALGVAETQSGQVIRGLLDDPRLAPPSGQQLGRGIRQLARILVRTSLPGRLVRALRSPDAARETALRAVEGQLQPGRPPASGRAALAMVEQLLDSGPGIIVRLVPLVLGGVASLGLARKLAGPEALLATRGLPHNPTTEMNLELWSLATRLRSDEQAARLLVAEPPAELSARYLRGELPPAFQAGLADFLARYGFRAVAEIDLGVPRWRDDPTYVFGVLANYLRLDRPDQAPDAQSRRGAAEAQAAVARIVAQARRSGPLGRGRAAALRFLFSRLRALAGVRERPKFTVVRLLDQCRRLLLWIGAGLVEQGRLERADDVLFLDLAEARRALTGDDLRATVAERREHYAREQRRRLVPRVLLSDGQTFYGGAVSPEAGASADELAGAAASPGVYTGQARVILDPSGARLEPGEVLVTPSTDPGWTPLFLTAGALVMEMGGMMSHGAVVAREYGIPAVVGLPGATDAIKTGQRIQVDGGRGIVSIVDDGAATFDGAG